MGRQPLTPERWPVLERRYVDLKRVYEAADFLLSAGCLLEGGFQKRLSGLTIWPVRSVMKRGWIA